MSARAMSSRCQLCAAALLVCLGTLATFGHAAEDYTDRSVIGEWRITSVLDYAEISGLTERETRKLIGTTVRIDDKHINIGKRICMEPEFTAELVERDMHLRDSAHATAENLRLPNPVTVVDLACASGYLRNPDQFVLSWKGVFFNAVRLKHKLPSKGSHTAR